MEKQIKLENKKGITLIALVITIIVLLILAGVTIATLTGDNGLLTKAGQVKNASEQANLEEEVYLALVENEADKYFNSNSSIEEKLKAIFEKSYGIGNITVAKSGKNYKVIVKDTKTRYRVKYNGKVEKYEEMDPTSVYARLDDDGTLYLRATQIDGYIIYSNSSSIGDTNRGLVLKVIIEEEIAPTNLYMMFNNCSNLVEIQGIQNLHTENATNMTYMFNGCNNLNNIDVSKFDTSKVTSMGDMFNQCFKLQEIDVSNWDTSKVIYMGGLFSRCHAVKKLDVEGFDTSNVTNMSYMFNNCNQITNIDVSNFDTSKVTNMAYMFHALINISQINVSNFDTGNVTNMSNMFNNCKKVNELNLSIFNTSNVTDMSYMFNHCESVKIINVSSFDTSKVTNMSYMFNCCDLENINISNFDTNKVTDMAYMFYGGDNLKNIDLSGQFVINQGTNLNEMFNIFTGRKIKTKQDTANKLKEKFTKFTDENFEIVT